MGKKESCCCCPQRIHPPTFPRRNKTSGTNSQDVLLQPRRPLLWYGIYATRRTRNEQANTCTLTVSVLLVNAIAILSEDRFLARSTHLHLYCREIATDNIQTVGWGSTQQEPAFGGPSDNTSVKSKVINLISSVRTLMRSTCSSCVCRISCADFSAYSTAYRHQHSHHRLRTYTGMKDYTRACA